jgi:hypothetical protein
VVRSSQRILLAAVLCCAGIAFVIGAQWGLPSRAADRFLFGDRPPWTGREVLGLTGGWGGDTDIGADVDPNPLGRRDRPIVLNDTDARRAEIVQRYRIQSYQPDEHITFRALARMRPGQLALDPGLYQYGGLWIYPVGALLKAASIAGWVDLRSDVAFYLEHPEAFGRFYVVARLYSAAWGVVAAWAVFCLARRLAGCAWAAAAGAACFAAMPVVVNMAHEAKPHLPGLALMLLTVLAACRYVESGNRRWAWAAGALAGAAFGMVISSLVIFCVLPVMALLRPLSWRDRVRIAAVSALLGAATYALTNPFVPINLLRNRALLMSNLGTSTAMYEVNATGGALGNAVRLIAEGTSPVAAGLGAIALVAWGVIAVKRRKAEGGDATCGRLLPPGYVLCLVGVPAAFVLLQFVALGSGKPGEYGRFALLPDTVLLLAAVAGAARLPWPRAAGAGLCVLFLTTAAFGTVYLAKFVADARPATSRLAEAGRLRDLNAGGARHLLIVAEPAPYCLPPVNVFDWTIELAPRGVAPDAGVPDRADVLVRAVDRPGRETPAGFVRLPPLRSGLAGHVQAPISWADKPFEVLVRSAGGQSVARGRGRGDHPVPEAHR